MEQSSQGVNPIEWRTEDSATCSMKKCTLLFATGSNQKYGFPYSLHREVAAVVVAVVLQMHIWYAHPLPYDGVAFVRLPKVHCVFIHARICLSTSSSPAKAMLLEQAVAIASKIWHYNQVSLPRTHDCKYVCNILRGTWPAKRWDQKLPILVSGIEAFLN